MNKKFSALFASTLMMGTLLTGCGTSDEATDAAAEAANDDERVVIDFWAHWGSEQRRPVIEQIVDDFNASQDRIEVRYTFLPYGDIWTKNLSAIAAGDPPDVIINQMGPTANRAANNQVEDISQFLDDDFSESFLPQLWADVEGDNGEVWAVPFNTDTRLLFYNKDLFEEAGLDPKAPETWEEAYEMSQALTITEGDRITQFGFYPMGTGGNYDLWLTNADGQGFFNEDETPRMATSEKAEAVDWLRQFVDLYGERNIQAFKADAGDGSGMTNPFLSGKFAMWVDVATFYTQIRDFAPEINLGVAPLPARTEGATPYSRGGGFVAEVPKGSDNVEEAVEFIKFLTGIEGQSTWGSRTFDTLSNIEALENVSGMLEGDEKMVWDAMKENMEHTLLLDIPMNVVANFWSLVDPHIENAIFNGQDSMEALEAIQEALEQEQANSQ